MTAALQTRQLSADLGGRRVLQGIDLQIAAGRWTCVVGPNGAGKTTLFNCLSGFQAVDTGSMVFRGAALETRAPQVGPQMRRRVTAP